jgi:hypothetical protein
MKAYTTFAGAQRAANGKPIVRLLDDPREIFVVIDRLDTDVMIFTTDGPRSRRYERAGAINAIDIPDRPARLKNAYAQLETTARDLLKEIDRIGLSGAAVGERNALGAALAMIERAKVED